MLALLVAQKRMNVPERKSDGENVVKVEYFVLPVMTFSKVPHGKMKTPFSLPKPSDALEPEVHDRRREYAVAV